MPSTFRTIVPNRYTDKLGSGQLPMAKSQYMAKFSRQRNKKKPSIAEQFMQHAAN